MCTGDQDVCDVNGVRDGLLDNHSWICNVVDHIDAHDIVLPNFGVILKYKGSVKPGDDEMTYAFVIDIAPSMLSEGPTEGGVLPPESGTPGASGIFVRCLKAADQSNAGDSKPLRRPDRG